MTAGSRVELARLTRNYVDGLKSKGAITSRAVERAFRAVPRHVFIETIYRPGADWSERSVRVVHFDRERPDPDHLRLIYSDDALVTAVQNEMPVSSASQPSLVASMLELLELKGGERVLEIGTGTGYNAALLSEVVGPEGRVVTMEVDGAVAASAAERLQSSGHARVEVVCADGLLGSPERGPYDRVVATVRPPDLSPHWIEQLADGGFVLVPLEHGGLHPLVKVGVAGGRVAGQVVGWSSFMPMRGYMWTDGPWRQRFSLADDWEVLRSRGDIRWRPGWPDLGGGRAIPWTNLSEDETRFLMYLSVRDGRAVRSPWGFGLSEGVGAWAITGEEGIHGLGDDRLLRELERCHEDWNRDGRPRAFDYRIHFVPRESHEQDLGVEDFVVRRKYFEELLSLG